LTKTGKHAWIYTDNKMAKFHGNILSLSENTAKCFRGATFLTHTVCAYWTSTLLIGRVFSG